MRPFASCINLNQTSSGSPHLLGKGQMGTQTQGKTGFEKTGSILAVPQITAGEAAGTRTGTFVGRSFNKPRLRGAHTALSASGQSCTCLIPPGPATVLIPPAQCPQPPPCCRSRTILTSQCQWGGSAGTHHSRPGGPGSGAG